MSWKLNLTIHSEKTIEVKVSLTTLGRVNQCQFTGQDHVLCGIHKKWSKKKPAFPNGISTKEKDCFTSSN